MAISPRKIADNIQRLRDRIAQAASRSRRDPAGVQLVAVTKSAEPEDLRTLVELGVTDLAESRVQQLIDRKAQLDEWLARRKSPVAVRWHMVGHLQRNKVKSVLECCCLIHSVDSLRLAEEIDARAAAAGISMDVLLQVNCSQERQKFGVAVAAAPHLAEQISTLKNLRLLGLMTMAEQVSDPEQARPAFARLRELFEEMRNDKIGGKVFCHLSMGMSQDFTVAVEEGATMLRIGTALLA